MLLNHSERDRPGTDEAPGPRTARRRVALALALASGAVVIGGTMLSAPPEPNHRTAASATALHRLPPVTELLFSWTPTQARSDSAQRKLAIACMAEQGFHYAPVPRAADGGDQRPQPFGLEGIPSGSAAQPGPAPSEAHEGEAFGRALFGDPEKRVTAKGRSMSVSRPGNGCLAHAEKRMLGDGRIRWLQLRIMFFEAQEQARQDVEKDSVFRESTSRWRQCMKRAGFTQRDPVQLQRALPSGTDRRTSPAVRADLRCKDETGYLSTAYTRLAAMQQGWLDRNPDITRDWQMLLHRQDRAARDVLGTEG